MVLTSTFPRWKGDHEPPFVFELAKRLARDYRVIVLAPHAAGARCKEIMTDVEVIRYRYFLPKLQRLAYNGGILANLERYPWTALLILPFLLSQWLSLLRVLHQQRISVIHAHWLIPQGAMALAARAFLRTARPGVLVTSHGGDLFALKGWPFRSVKRRIIRAANEVTVVSKAMRDYAAALSDTGDIEIIPMGVDLKNKFTPSGEERRDESLIVFVGRLVKKKGLRHLLLAIPEIRKSFPAVKLIIAGTGSEERSLRDLTRELDLTDRVEFLGPVSNSMLPALYRRASVFVGPSEITDTGDQEGLGLVFVEALGCECPVIATDLPGIRDVVIDGKTGLICRQKDSTDLARKILYLLQNPEFAKQLGKAGRRHVLDRFDWEIVADRYSQLLRRIMDTRIEKQIALPAQGNEHRE